MLKKSVLRTHHRAEAAHRANDDSATFDLNKYKLKHVKTDDRLTFFNLLDDVIRQREALLCVWKRQDLRLMLTNTHTELE